MFGLTLRQKKLDGRSALNPQSRRNHTDVGRDANRTSQQIASTCDGDISIDKKSSAPKIGLLSASRRNPGDTMQVRTRRGARRPSPAAWRFSESLTNFYRPGRVIGLVCVSVRSLETSVSSRDFVETWFFMSRSWLSPHLYVSSWLVSSFHVSS